VRLRNRLLTWTAAAALLPSPGFAQFAPPRLNLVSTAEQPHSPALGRRPHRDRRQPRADLGRAQVLQPQSPPARRRAAVSAARRPRASAARRWTSTGGCATRCRSTRRAAGRSSRTSRAPTSTRPCSPVTQGNNYKLRVYRSCRRATRSWCCATRRRSPATSPLSATAVPLYYAGRLPELSVAVRVVGARGAPQAPSGALKAPAFRADGDVYVNEVTRRDSAGRGVLKGRRPNATLLGQLPLLKPIPDSPSAAPAFAEAPVAASLGYAHAAPSPPHLRAPSRAPARPSD